MDKKQGITSTLLKSDFPGRNSGIFFDISISLPTFAVSIKLITLKLKCYGKLARISF